MKNRISTAVAAVALITVSLFAQSKPSIQGVWRRVETTVTNPNPAPGALTKGTHTNVQPGLFIFTARHYSVQIDSSAKPRPSVKDPTKATREELLAAWQPFTSNSGTYDVSGSTLTMRQMVAKNAENQGKAITRATIKLEGDNLWVTIIEVPGSGKVQYPTTGKYVRVE